jgi:hypothetical protein
MYDDNTIKDSWVHTILLLLVLEEAVNNWYSSIKKNDRANPTRVVPYMTDMLQYIKTLISSTIPIDNKTTYLVCRITCKIKKFIETLQIT